MKLKTAAIALLSLLTLVGCKKPESQTSAVTQPADPPRQSVNFLSVNDQEIQLPPTRILLLERDPITLAVYSSAGDTGNTLRLVLIPPANSLSELNGVEYDFRISKPQWTETTEGIVVENGKWVFQPYDVKTLTFCNGKWVRIELLGQFLAFTQGSVEPQPDRVKVKGLWEGNLEIRD